MIVQSIKKKNKQDRYKFYIYALFFITLTYYVVEYFFSTSDFFKDRFEKTLEGYSSNRDILYDILWNHFIYDTNALQFFFGSGANATLEVMGQYAHNDWLEIAINQGLMGVMVFFVYWVAAYKDWKRAPKNEAYTIAMGLIFLAYFLKTFFSMSYGDMQYYATMALGYCLAKVSEHRVLKSKKSI